MNDNPSDNLAPDTPQTTDLPPTPEYDREPATQSSSTEAAVFDTNQSEIVAPSTPTTDERIRASTIQDQGASKKSKKPLVLAAVLATAVILFGGGAAAYAFWYQNPQKVVTDAVVNMLKADSVVLDGEVTIDNLGDEANSVDKLALTFDSQATRTSGLVNAKLSVDTEGKNITLEGSALVDSDASIYFKAKNTEQVLKDYMGFEVQESPQLSKFIDKIDDKWIRISADDYESISKEASQTQKCVSNTFKKFETDKDAQAQVASVYRSNQFIVIEKELGVKDGNIGYVIDGDEEKAKSFVRDLQNTDVYKNLQKCDDNFEINLESITFKDDKAADQSLEVWISRLDHELRQIKAVVTDGEVEADLVVNVQSNQPVNIEAPQDYVSLKDLMEDLMNVVAEQMSNSFSELENERAVPVNVRQNPSSET